MKRQTSEILLLLNNLCQHCPKRTEPSNSSEKASDCGLMEFYRNAPDQGDISSLHTGAEILNLRPSSIVDNEFEIWCLHDRNPSNIETDELPAKLFVTAI